ncbi:hypothetical protein RRG08_053360 [Elysia crispata]|uniref:Uncharacterized protein n=1 Tax=Elysia crispata TaxID=231223 RepID=A0AAE0ZL89_9GAST|nr:hypothetical protein RRG08_053360 [Elysia crispata]
METSGPGPVSVDVESDELDHDSLALFDDTPQHHNTLPRLMCLSGMTAILADRRSVSIMRFVGFREET